MSLQLAYVVAVASASHVSCVCCVLFCVSCLRCLAWPWQVGSAPARVGRRRRATEFQLQHSQQPVECVCSHYDKSLLINLCFTFCSLIPNRSECFVAFWLFYQLCTDHWSLVSPAVWIVAVRYFIHSLAVTVNTQSAPSAHRRASEQLPLLLFSRSATHSGSSSGVGGGVNKEATVVEQIATVHWLQRSGVRTLR